MFWWTYYLTSTVGPGYVPKDWVPDIYIVLISLFKYKLIYLFI